jgi:hypothetical protein
MAKVGVYDYYKGLPAWAKGLVIVGGGVVVFLLGRKLYQYAFPPAEELKNRQLLNNASTELVNAQRRGINPSYTDTQYSAFANQIYQSMRFAVGDDYSTAQSNLKKMKNDVDVLKLIKAFGQRQNYFFGLPNGNPLDLFTFVKSELGNEYLGLTSYRISDINADWKKKGISYQI